MNNAELTQGLQIMIYGMGTTFFMLIAFYGVIRLLNRLFPTDDNK